MKKFLFLFFIVYIAQFSYAQNEDLNDLQFNEICSIYDTAPSELKSRIDSIFTDYVNEHKAIQVKSICNVPFGSSMDEASYLLHNKFGAEMNIKLNDLTISYEDIKYAGIDFKNVYFMFQSDGIRNYFNCCIFVKPAKTKEEAAKIMELYKSVLSNKYDLVETEDAMGFKSYGGGISPLWNGHWYPLVKDINSTNPKYLVAIKTDVIEYDSTVVESFGNKYGVRMIYGPYEYVTEEF